MMGDLQLVSGISAPRIKQSINFLSIEAVGVVVSIVINLMIYGKVEIN